MDFRLAPGYSFLIIVFWGRGGDAATLEADNLTVAKEIAHVGRRLVTLRYRLGLNSLGIDRLSCE